MHLFMLVSLHTGKNNVEASVGSSLWAADMPHRVVTQATRAGYFFPGGTSVVQIKMEVGTIVGNYLLLPFPLHSFLSSFPPLALPPFSHSSLFQRNTLVKCFYVFTY